MAAPTQELPPWLSYSTAISTGPDGVAVTETSLVYLPLTYYGPSIPLGTVFTYGGLTPPASTSTTTPVTTSPTTSPTTSAPTSTPAPTSTSASTSTPATSTSATPSSSSSIPLSSSSSSLSISSSISSTPSSSFPSSSSSFPTPSETSSSDGLSRGALVGIIVGSVLAGVLLFVAALILFLCCRKGSPRSGHDFHIVTPIDEDYLFVDASPRHSGEEGDPFLNRRGMDLPRNGGGGSAATGATGAGAATAAYHAVPTSGDEREFGASASPENRDSSGPGNGDSSNSRGSGGSVSSYGTVLPTQRLSNIAASSSPAAAVAARRSMPEEELKRIEEESYVPSDFGDEKAPISDLPPAQQRHLDHSSPTDPELAAMLIPPRLVEQPGHPNLRSQTSWEGSRAGTPDSAQEAEISTARRVRVTPPMAENVAGSSSKRGSWIAGLGALGLGGLAQSLFGKGEPSSQTRRTSWTEQTPLSDKDVEQGRALLASPTSPASPASDYNEKEFGVARPRPNQLLGSGGTFGERPTSTLTTKSGGTVFYDAESGPQTPLMSPPPAHTVSYEDLPPLPVSRHSSKQSLHETSQQEQGQQHFGNERERPPDVLDTPAPRPASPFASTSSKGTKTTASSETKVDYPYPPGLSSLPTPAVWHEAHTNSTPSGISIDVLEEEPPAALESWRQGRRTTFGLPHLVHPSGPDHASEQGSLHSMRSQHLSVSGSAASSARRGQNESGSSNGSKSSAGSGLSHSGSITSDGRRRRAARSPALSAIGPTIPSPTFGAMPSWRDSAPMPSPLGSPQMGRVMIEGEYSSSSGHGHSSREATGTSSESGPRSAHSPPLSPVPWAGGLSPDWRPS